MSKTMTCHTQKFVMILCGVNYKISYSKLSSDMLLIITHVKFPVSLRIPDPPDAKFTPCRMLFFKFFSIVKKGGGLF